MKNVKETPPLFEGRRINAAQMESDVYMQFPKLFLPYIVNKVRILEDGHTSRYKAIVTSPYNKMRPETKIAYTALKNRTLLSLENNWIDKNGNPYIFYTIEELAETLGCGRTKASSIKTELIHYGLLSQEQQGLNKANRLYVCQFHYEEIIETEIENNRMDDQQLVDNFQEITESSNSDEVAKTDKQRTFRFRTPEEVSGGKDVQNLNVKTTARVNTSNTEYSHTDISDTEEIQDDSSSHLSAHVFQNIDTIDFATGFNRSYLSEKTVQLLNPFGVSLKKDALSANHLADIIFQTKYRVDLTLAGKQQPIDGLLWSSSIDFELEKFIRQWKLRRELPDEDKNKIRNPLAFWRKIMMTFWERTGEIEGLADPMDLYQRERDYQGQSFLEDYAGRYKG
ncbi:MAG: replication initiator protein A [Streptococcaceae bacterium]|nr:replication initiator protein A [Streptococcaceae bacterium]